MTMLLQARSLAVLPGVRHAFFTRAGGVSEGVYASLNAGVGSGDDPQRITENRARMAEALGVGPDRLVSVYQVHSPDVVVAEEPWPPEARPRADAVVTNRPGLAIAASTADCGPVLLADATARVIGAAHAGWRGALAGVTDATIEAMERLGARRARIVAAIGPMIRQSNYEVGPEVVDQFLYEEPDNRRFFAPSARVGRAMFDLAGYIAARLVRAEVMSVEDISVCTYADADRFYSYRRMTHLGETDYGRHLNAIAIAPE
jgi:purine-nucleoside/S-methyl-5'-thioadenosine phosphorylase / adenosine deaminase